MDIDEKMVSPAVSEWIDVLIKEYEAEVKIETRWPTLLLQSYGRKQLWNLCIIFGVNSKGVPGSACRLLEKYLSRTIRNFLEEYSGSTDGGEWERYKDLVMSRLHLLMVSCIQLAAKMSDLLAPLTATMVRATLMKKGIVYTKAAIVEMEFHVYSTLDFCIPLWTTLEMGEFLAYQVGLKGPTMIQAVGLMIDLTELYRDKLERHMKYQREIYGIPGTPSSPGKVTVHNLHMCAGAVLATALYMRSPITDLLSRLALFIQCNIIYIKAISDTILRHIIPEKKYIPILKKKRLQ